jgi:LPXTG-motif cell wall-anchored protein
MGGIKPIPAPVKPAVVVQELPQTGPSDDNSYMTLLGLAASAATYGAVLLLQRRNA